MLPGIDGVEVCERIRKELRTPIIMLTALGAPEDRIEGLEAGADNISQSVLPQELVLQVRSVLRRSLEQFAPEAPFTIGPFHLDPSGEDRAAR